jgi:HPt (histidine-containing phosphotransfer) domain-containing protein
MLTRWAGPRPSRLGELLPFDADAMHSRFGGDAELKDVALTTFRHATPELLERLRIALVMENRPQLKLLAHSAKGGGSMVAAERYAATAAVLEERAPDAPIEELRGLVEDLQAAFDRFAEAVGPLTAR